jgi:hypothetical protein
MRFDGVEVPTYRQIIERERHETPLVVIQGNAVARSLPDDFDSWEAGLDISDLRSLQHDDISGMSLSLPN